MASDTDGLPTPDLFAPVESRTLRENVFNLIEEAILAGKIRPGERLNESHLARQFRVSRAPIREALQQLQEKGLAVNSPRRGMFVVRLEDADIQKINRLRVLLESEALRQCRSHLTLPVADKLISLMEKMESAARFQSLAAIQLDMEFHRVIWQTTDNEYLYRILHGLTAPLFAHALLRDLKSEKMVTVLHSHRPLLDYVRGEIDVPAEEVMVEHFKVRWNP